MSRSSYGGSFPLRYTGTRYGRAVVRCYRSLCVRFPSGLVDDARFPHRSNFWGGRVDEQGRRVGVSGRRGSVRGVPGWRPQGQRGSTCRGCCSAAGWARNAGGSIPPNPTSITALSWLEGHQSRTTNWTRFLCWPSPFSHSAATGLASKQWATGESPSALPPYPLSRISHQGD